MIPWFLIFFCTFIILFQTRLKYNDRTRNKKKDTKQFLIEDTLANFSRVKPIDSDMIITVDEGTLPFGVTQTEQITEIEEKIRNNLAKPLINTHIDTNYEAKQRFGLKNLQTIIDGEENFTYFIKNLNTWAEYLIESGNTNSAESVLVVAADSGSDISETYILLYGLYKQESNRDKLLKLNERIDSLPVITKNRVLKVIGSNLSQNPQQ